MKSIHEHFKWKFYYFFKNHKNEAGTHIDLDKLRFSASDRAEELRNHSNNRAMYDHMLKTPAMDFALRGLLKKYEEVVGDVFKKHLDSKLEELGEAERVKEFEAKKRAEREAEYGDEDDADDGDDGADE